MSDIYTLAETVEARLQIFGLVDESARGALVHTVIQLIKEADPKAIHLQGREEAALFLEHRADEIETMNGGGPTQIMIARIFRDEAKSIRGLI